MSDPDAVSLSKLFEVAAQDELEGDFDPAEVERVLFGRTSTAAPRTTMLGRYLRLERLGGGGNGVVYAAYDPELQRKVAIKLLRPTVARVGSMAEERLIREARALSQVSHPHVVPIYDIGRVEDEEGRSSVFLVMKRVQGQQLDDWLGAQARAWAEVCRVLVQAGRGLAAAHALGIVHRDFKPANVLVAQTDVGPHAVVLDFGLAFGLGAPVTDAGDGASEPLDERLTAAGSTVGTPLYMSPEQHVRDEIDARSDQFSLCAVLYEALVGRLPWAGGSLAQQAAIKAEGSTPPRGRGVPAQVLAVIRRGLSPRPEDRFASMDVLLDTLEAVPRRRRRQRWLAAGIVLVTVPSAGWLLHDRSVAAACRAEAEVATAAFSPDTDAALREAFAASSSFGGAAYDWASGELRSYRDALGASLVDSCEATRRRREQNPEARQRRDACLHHRADALGLLAASLRDGSASAATRLPDLVASLPDLGACDDAAVRAPAHAPWRVVRSDLERRRARIDLRSVLEPQSDASEQLDTLVAEAEAVGDRALLARVRLSQGEAWLRRLEVEAARDAFEAAILDAEAIGDEETVTRALRALAIAYQSKDSVRFEQLLRRVAARVEHHSLGAVFSARVSLSFAHLYLLTERTEQAEAAARSAHQTLVDALGSSHPLVATALDWEARAHHAEGDLEAARRSYRAATELRTEVLGPRHPLVHGALENWGLLELDAGEPAAAKALLERLAQGQRERLGADAPATLWARAALGGAMIANGEVEEGVALIEAALARLDRTEGANTTAHAELLFHAAGWLDRGGRHEAAVRLAERAVEILEQQVDPDHPTLARARRELVALRRADAP